MSTVNTIDGDLLVRGSLVVTGTVSLPDGTVTNAKVSASADIDASKLEHQYSKVIGCAKVGVDAASEAYVAHVVYGATGTILAFKAGAVTVAGATTSLTVDLKKNGTTVLSAVITLNNGQSNYQLVSGTVTTPTLAAGDVLTVHFALSGTNEPQGAFAHLVLREDAA